MRAVTVEPLKAGSAALEEVPVPTRPSGWILARAIALGVCGTDVDIVHGHFGEPPPQRSRLILGHESLAEVVEAPADCGFAKGDIIAGIVRRPDPVPCVSCAAGEWDMCRNGKYTERGIKAIDGFGSELFVIEPQFAVPVDRKLGLAGVLTEPASVLAKAWDHIERIGRRGPWQPKKVLVTGAGPIGLLAAMMGVQRGLEVHVLDKVTSGPKPQLVRDLGAVYHSDSVERAGEGADIVIECTGVAPLIYGAMRVLAGGGVVCLTGLSPGRAPIEVDMAELDRHLVLCNDVVFGSVNAGRRHYELGAEALAKADRRWLDRVINRSVPLERWSQALERQPDDVKPIIRFGDV
jgi:threonine dehydrogenase-like Zn-dependent dehydrogenase